MYAYMYVCIFVDISNAFKSKIAKSVNIQKDCNVKFPSHIL